MKRFFLFLTFLCLLSPLAQGQVLVEVDGGAAKMRPMGMADYDRQEAQARMTHEDSVDYQSCVVQAFNYLAADSLEAARVLFEKALSLSPGDVSTWKVRHNLGLVCLAQNRLTRAEELFTGILRQLPDERSVRADRATTRLAMNHAREATEDLDVLLRTETSDSLRAFYLNMRASASMQRRRYSEARRDLKEVLRLTPDNMSATLLFCSADFYAGNREQALLMLSGFIAAHPKSAVALSLRADFFEKMGQEEQARLDLEEAMRLSPYNDEYRLQYDRLKDSSRGKGRKKR